MPTRVHHGLPELNTSTRRMVTLLLRSGPMPRVELARRLSLTPASLTKLTRPMLEIGLFKQVDLVEKGSAGRPVQPLSVNPRWASFVGVKLTARYLYAVLTDLAGTVVAAIDFPLTSSDVATVSQQIVRAVNILRADVSPAAVGISLAGTVLSSRGRIVNSPFLGWADVDLAADLERRVHVPVVVENDLRALATGQHWLDDTLTSFALVTFGAGIGCGLVVDDRPVRGSGGGAGLIDHLRVDDHGPMCERGHRGCVSGYATTAAILRAAAAAGAAGSTPRTLADVGALARSGNHVAAGALRRAGYAVGRVIGTVCNIAGPARVILSGEGVEIAEHLEDALRQGIQDITHPVLPPVPLTIAPLTFTEWARGSAVVAIQHHLETSRAPS